MVCAKVDDYIDNIVKELNLPSLVVGNQLLIYDHLQTKHKGDHWKIMVELRMLEELTKGMLNKFIVSPCRVATRLQESLMFIQFKLKQVATWDPNLILEAKLLYTVKVREIHDKLGLWRKYFK